MALPPTSYKEQRIARSRRPPKVPRGKLQFADLRVGKKFLDHMGFPMIKTNSFEGVSVSNSAAVIIYSLTDLVTPIEDAPAPETKG